MIQKNEPGAQREGVQMSLISQMSQVCKSDNGSECHMSQRDYNEAIRAYEHIELKEYPGTRECEFPGGDMWSRGDL